MEFGNPIIVDTNQEGWEEVKQPWYAKPIRRKVLHRDAVTGGLHILVNYPKDLQAPAHHHSCAHTIFVLENALIINGQTYPAGTYAHFPAGETMLHTSPEDQDCTFLIFFASQPDFVVEGGPSYRVQ
jgi:quercetin dioxygenase-like cupin family protein